jgi:hypothetical protein
VAIGEYSINLPDVGQASSNFDVAVSSGCGVTNDVSSQVLDASAFGGIGSCVGAANCAMQDQLNSGLNQTMQLLGNVNGNVLTSANGYACADSAIAQDFTAIGSSGTTGTGLLADAGGIGGPGQGTSVLADAGSTAASDQPLQAVAAAPPVIPGAGSDPGYVNQWWNGLTQDQQQQLLSSNPAAIGSLDGIPIGVRNDINQGVVLPGLVDDTQNQITTLQYTVPPPTGDAGADMANVYAQQAQIDQLQIKLGGLQALQDQLANPNNTNMYLLGVDTDGPGHFIVAINDPTYASNVVTFVPGAETGLNAGEVNTDLGASYYLNASAAAAAPGQTTSVIVWANYNAPQSIVAGYSSDPAIQGAPALDQFQNGLYATTQNPDMTSTVIGHSYGSVVVGQASLLPGGLPADNVVVLGSPGMDVQNTSSFGFAQVYAARDTYDPVGLADLAGIHGADPVSPSFGATVFDAGPGSLLDPMYSHMYYFTPYSPALSNMGQIITGQPQNVTLPH